jgi:ABC-type Fe3+-hydroxamate transport system substrate-binding protein
MTALVDASGVALELAHPPRRIVSLIPSTTETLCRLGLSDALVGVTAYCVEPREVVRTETKVEGEKSPDLEATRALAPDLVIAVEEKKRGRRLKAWQQRDDRGGDGPSRCATISGAQSRSKTRQ